MRFSAVFDPPLPSLPLPQPAEVAAPETQATLPAAALGKPDPTQPLPPPPEDLDQRVRQTGEWQLEDW